MQKVLDKGFVELLDIMPLNQPPDMAVVNAARVSYLNMSKGEEQDKRLLFYLMQHHHTSPFEHVVFKFRVKAPVVTWWQWVRHRTWSYNFQSGRYTPFEENEYYIPEEWRLQSKSNKQASDGIVEWDKSDLLTTMYNNHVKNSYGMYETLISMGVAREQARIFLPGFAMYYTAICTVDAHNLMHFLQLRLPQEAQYEIRVYAQALKEILKETMPWTYEAFEKYRLGIKYEKVD